jgi:hypothetical protein
MSDQPPSGNLKWFKPQPDAEGKYQFPEYVQYLAATWCGHIREWSYAVGVFEPDTWDDHWELIDDGGVATDLEEIDWLARLDSGKPSPQKTLPGLEGGK